MDNYETILERMRKIANVYANTSLAEKIRVSVASFYNINQRGKISGAIFLKFFQAYPDTSINWLLFGKGSASNEKTGVSFDMEEFCKDHPARTLEEVISLAKSFGVKIEWTIKGGTYG